ncbi:hypothetical protein LguiA_003640 [Lonicera macranthoides]
MHEDPFSKMQTESKEGTGMALTFLMKFSPRTKLKSSIFATERSTWPFHDPSWISAS